MDITEFESLDPTRVDGVETPANGIGFLMLKSIDSAQEFVDGLCGDSGCDVCKDRYTELDDEQVTKAKLKAKERDALPDSTFALPEKRAYPIHDKSHARNALSRVSQNGTAEEKKKVRAAVHRKYPTIDEEDAAKQTASDKSVPTEEAETQTEEVSEDCSTGASPEPDDGGEPRHVAAADERPAEGDGQGDTAPDASVPRGEADSQTDDAQKTADAAKTTDPEPATTNTSMLQKEIQDMTYDELTKLLDERDAARRAEKEARKRAQAKKEEKREKKAAKAAAEAAEAADSDDDSDLAKARAELEALQARVEKMESADAQRIVTDPTGLVTALRGGPESAANVFKQLEDELAKAKEVWEKNPTRANEARMKEAGTRVVNAKLIAQDTARTSDPRYVAASLRGQGFPLFNNSQTFNDPKVQYDRGR